MERVYHERWLRLWSQFFWVLWFEDDATGVETEDGRILLFQGREGLRRYTMAQGFAVKDSHVVYDFDAAMNIGPEPTPAECAAVLSVMGLIDDFALSVDKEPASREGTNADVYEKLAAVALMPPVSSGPPVEIIFSDKERDVIRKHVRDGYGLFVRGTMKD